MSRRHLVVSFLAAAILSLPAWAWSSTAAGRGAHQVEIDIVGASGRQFSTFPLDSESRDVYRAYLEARDQERYRIRVRNRSGRRVGLVIAVDGRNIITGRKSDLAREERMYVLDPWESAQYEGWRTGSDRVNEFYFTEWRDAYAESFGDRSARGVIAVAVYRERMNERYHEQELRESSAAAPAPQASPAEPQSDEAARSAGRADQAPMARREAKSRAAAQPGTGFGDEVYSPVRRVQFDPEDRPASRHFIKYEWRDTLCRKGVIDCDRHERNRFWDEEDRFGYAPYPPRR